MNPHQVLFCVLVLFIGISPFCLAQNMSAAEMFYKLQFFRERRDSYYAINMDYINQRDQIDKSQAKLKINITVNAISASHGDIGKLNIPEEQYQIMMNNKNSQFQNLINMQAELNSLIVLTDIGFHVTQDTVTGITKNASGILYSHEKYQLNTDLKVIPGLNFTTTNGYLPNYATAHITSRYRNRLSAGFGHGMFLHYNGKLYSWGVDTGGCLGRPSTASSMPFPTLSYPVDILGNVTILQFTSAYYSNLVLGGDAVYSWGKNDYGVDGDGTLSNRLTPVKVFSWDLQGPKKIEYISSGAYSHYAVDDNGKAYAWGRNDRGQLGDRTTIDKVRPVDIYMNGTMRDQRVFKICGGISHGLVLTANNTLFTFGDNTYYQHGSGLTTPGYSMEAVQVKQTGALLGKRIVDIACGENHNIVLTADGKVFAWGLNNYGQLGDNTITNRQEPTAMYASSSIQSKTIVKIWTRFNVAFALASDGTLFAWGQNDNYQQGLGSTSQYNYPYTVPVTTYVSQYVYIVEVTIMSKTTLFIASDGRIYGSGYSSASKELMTLTSASSYFQTLHSYVSATGFVQEKRKYPYFETNDFGYQFVGDSYSLFPDNGFYLYKKNLSQPLNWTIVEYVNNTGKMFQGSIYNTHTFRTNDYIYMFGGMVNNTISNAMYRALVSNVEKGWDLLRFTLPYAVTAAQSILVDDYFYIMGGLTNVMAVSGDLPVVSLSSTKKIMRCHISNPTQFEVLTDVLPVPVYSGSRNIGRVKETILIFGGRTIDNAPYSDILRAPYLFPTKWENTYSVLPFQIADATMVVTENYVYMFGGYYSVTNPADPSVWNNAVYGAPTSEPVGSWMTTGDFLPHIITPTTALYGNYLYLYGNEARYCNSYPLSPYVKTAYEIKFLQ